MATRKKRIVEIQIVGYRTSYTFYPASQDTIKNALRKMQDKTGVKTAHELAICESALIAAGIQRASESNSTHVTPRHVLEGYNQGFRISMEHALYKCMPRSVLNRTSELRTHSAVFDTLLSRLNE